MASMNPTYSTSSDSGSTSDTEIISFSDNDFALSDTDARDTLNRASLSPPQQRRTNDNGMADMLDLTDAITGGPPIIRVENAETAADAIVNLFRNASANNSTASAAPANARSNTSNPTVMRNISGFVELPTLIGDSFSQFYIEHFLQIGPFATRKNSFDFLDSLLDKIFKNGRYFSDKSKDSMDRLYIAFTSGLLDHFCLDANQDTGFFFDQEFACLIEKHKNAEIKYPPEVIACFKEKVRIIPHFLALIFQVLPNAMSIIHTRNISSMIIKSLCKNPNEDHGLKMKKIALLMHSYLEFMPDFIEEMLKDQQFLKDEEINTRLTAENEDDFKNLFKSFRVSEDEIQTFLAPIFEFYNEGCADINGNALRGGFEIQARVLKRRFEEDILTKFMLDYAKALIKAYGSAEAAFASQKTLMPKAFLNDDNFLRNVYTFDRRKLAIRKIMVAKEDIKDSLHLFSRFTIHSMNFLNHYHATLHTYFAEMYKSFTEIVEAPNEQRILKDIAAHIHSFDKIKIDEDEKDLLSIAKMIRATTMILRQKLRSLESIITKREAVQAQVTEVLLARNEEKTVRTKTAAKPKEAAKTKKKRRRRKGSKVQKRAQAQKMQQKRRTSKVSESANAVSKGESLSSSDTNDHESNIATITASPITEPKQVTQKKISKVKNAVKTVQKAAASRAGKAATFVAKKIQPAFPHLLQILNSGQRRIAFRDVQKEVEGAGGKVRMGKNKRVYKLPNGVVTEHPKHDDLGHVHPAAAHRLKELAAEAQTSSSSDSDSDDNGSARSAHNRR